MILTVTANPAVDVAYFVDSFKMGEVHRPVRTAVTAGGKGLNVSRVAAALGEKVTAMGFVGGANGSFIETEAERMGLGCRFVHIEGETRKNIDIIDSSGNTGEILESGPEVTADGERAFLKAYTEEVPRHDVICISGSLPVGIDGDFYCKLITVAKENGKKVIVDTSGSALEKVITAKPYMIKPNSHELSCLFGAVDVKEALRMLYDMGVEVPFATLGGDGAVLFDGGKYYSFSIPRVKVKNTVGSGDSTVGGIAVGLSRGMPLCEAVRLGMAAGIANTQFDQSGTVTPELVDRFYNEVGLAAF